MMRARILWRYIDDENDVVTQRSNRETGSVDVFEQVLNRISAFTRKRCVECHGKYGFRGQGASGDGHQHVAGTNPSCSCGTAGNHRDYAGALAQSLSGDHAGTVGQLEL